MDAFGITTGRNQLAIVLSYFYIHILPNVGGALTYEHVDNPIPAHWRQSR